MRKTVVFDPYVTIMEIPAGENTSKMTIPEKNQLSYENVVDEVRRRRKEAIRIAKENIMVLNHNGRLLREVLKSTEKSHEDYEYYRSQLEETLFSLEQWKLKTRHYNKTMYGV